MEEVMILVRAAVQFLQSSFLMPGGFGNIFFWIILGTMGEIAIIIFRTALEG
jgi:capsular polysaccharide biosynthesis protein